MPPKPSSQVTNPARVEALRGLNLLDTEAEEGFDRISRLAAQVLGAPTCLLSLVDDRRQFFKSAVGLTGPVAEARQTPLTHSFCQHVVTSGAPLVVDDALNHPDVSSNPAVRDFGVMAYLGSPIRSPDGFVLGSFCVVEGKPRKWNAHEIDLIQELAKLVETEISLKASLREKERALSRLGVVLNGTTYSIIATSPTGVIEVFNAGAESMLGYRAEELVGKETPAIIHLASEVEKRAVELSVELDRLIEPGFEVFVALARTRGAEEREWTYVRKDGSHLPVSLNVTALRDSAGAITGFLGVAQDISLRKLIESIRHEDLTRLSKLGSQVPGMIYQYRRWPDGSSCFPYASEGIRSIYRVTPEEVREDAGAAFAALHPDDLAAVAESIEVSARTLQKWSCEYRVRFPDGTVRWLHGNSMPEREADGSVLWHGFITDVTARKETEFEKHLGEERVRLAAEAAGVAVWEWDILADKILWDTKMFEIYDCPPSANLEVEYRTWAEAVHPDDLPAQEEQLKTLVRSGGRAKREFRIIRRSDRSVRFLQSAEMLVRDAQGRPIRVVGINVDITEHKASEAALQITRKRLEQTFVSMSEGLVLQDAEGMILENNPAAEKLLGLTKEQLCGRTSCDPNWKCVRADGSPFPGAEHPAMVTLTTGRAQRDVVMGVSKADGSLAWIEINSELIGAPGDPARQSVCSFRDITARRSAEMAMRSSEEIFRTLAQHAPVGIFRTDANGRCEYINERWTQLAGLALAEARGDGWSRALHPEDRARIFAEWQAAARENREFTAEYRFQHDSGRVVWVAGSAVALRGLGGRVTGYLGTVADITGRKELETSLALARDQALEASRLKSEFLATMSHEIRTPMNAVIGMAGLLADTSLNDEQAEMVRTMVGGAENLLTIINDILDFSRIEAGRMRIDPTVFDFQRVVEETVTLLAPRAHEKGIELTCEFQAELVSMLLGDGGRVRQVLTNLIGNAIKFTDAGEVDVTVSMVRQTSSQVRMRVAVRDTGVGIPYEAQTRLFQPFTQIDGSTTRRFGGTGLGLAISRQLIELMCGEIGFESDPGTGSVFWFELDFPREGTRIPVSGYELPTGRRALVVDDNATNRRILAAQLERWGVEVQTVPNATSALALLTNRSTGPWHLILLDWHMPGLDGLQLAKAIRRQPALAHLPLVMLSSAGPQADPDADKGDFAAFLTKPVTSLQLNRCISRVFSDSLQRGEEEGKSAVADARRGCDLRLLLAEDNPANQRVASLLLSKLGYTVEIASNGAVALEKLVVGHYDVVLMDCQMPVLDGYKATGRIRSGTLPGVNPQIPIIALTAYARAEDRARCIGAGMDDYLTKPIRVAELRTALERCGFEPRTWAPAAVNSAPPILPEAEKIFDEQAMSTACSLVSAGGGSLLAELVEMYLREEAERLEQLSQLAAEKRAEPLADSVHSFGGNAASFGGLQVRRIALDLEQSARAGDWAAVSDKLIQLKSACARLRAELERLNLAAK